MPNGIRSKLFSAAVECKTTDFKNSIAPLLPERAEDGGDDDDEDDDDVGPGDSDKLDFRASVNEEGMSKGRLKLTGLGEFERGNELLAL